MLLYKVHTYSKILSVCVYIIDNLVIYSEKNTIWVESELSTEVNPNTTSVDHQSFGDWWREFRYPIISEACEGNPRRIPPEADNTISFFYKHCNGTKVIARKS